MAANLELDEFLWKSGLADRDTHGDWVPLTGGVSSDIWRVDINNQTLCVKRALSKLKVDADWFVSTQRNAYEWAWLSFAARHLPSNVPTPLAHDAAGGVLAMSFLPTERYPVWKQKLLSEEVNVAFAAEVGRLVARLHSISTDDQTLIDCLGDTESFEAIRLDPYLSAAGLRHPEVAQQLERLIERTKSIRIAAVHGDISPKNILVGPAGPVFLDAEASWYGDPAFDLAFCLNHLLLKCLVRPASRSQYLQSFGALANAYLEHTDWESRDGLEHRAATLVPALLLARVDGKSPVEYLTAVTAQLARTAALDLINTPPIDLADLAQRWAASTIVLAS
jgi:aminoglycoside phosphotransferase (APT) family kinase protein